MIVLDTNVISELMEPDPDPAVVGWVDARPADEFCVTATTVAEILYGVGLLPEGRRRARLARRFGDVLDIELRGRVLPFDADAAADYADVVLMRRRAGRPISMADAQIAATARIGAATLATRNVRDFEGLSLSVIDPWTAP